MLEEPLGSSSIYGKKLFIYQFKYFSFFEKLTFHISPIK